jgi:hypothetical protein
MCEMAAPQKAKFHEGHADKRAADHDHARLAQRIGEVGLDAVASLAPAKVEDLVRQWLAKKPLDPGDPASALLALEAVALAGYLTLFSPSLLGAAPVERFIRQRRATADDLTRVALDALAQASFHLIRLKARMGPQRVVVEDMANGETLSLIGRDIPNDALSVCVAAWLVLLPSGDVVALGPLTPLCAGALVEGLAFVRPGKGMSNARRCAAAVYRHVARHGGLRVEGLNVFPENARAEHARSEAEREYDELDRLAQAVRTTADGETLSDETVAEARRLAAPPHLILALSRSVAERRNGRADFSAAFSRIGSIMMETLDLRARVGSGGDGLSLDALAAAIDRAIAEKRLLEDARALFEVLRRRLVASSKRAGDAEASGEAELMRVLQRIQALRAKTVERGCTEQEALASARKVAELLDRYGLSLSEVEMRDQACQGFGIDTARQRRAPIDDCMPIIALFCDCKVWTEASAGNTIRFVFFGLPADIEAAYYLHDLIAATFVTETARFKDQDATIASSDRRVTTRSFQIGLAHGIREKLTGMKAERNAANRRLTGRDLVPLKASVIEEEMEKLGLSFRAKAQNHKRKVAPDAYNAGRAAGRKFVPQRSVPVT